VKYVGVSYCSKAKQSAQGDTCDDDILTHREKADSSPIMDEIYPTLRAHIFLPSQFPYSVPKCLCRSLVIRHSLPPFREQTHRSPSCSGVLSIDVCHRPHRSKHPPKSSELHCRSKMQSLACDAIFRQLCCVTSGKESRFGRGKLRPYNFEQCEALALVNLERRITSPPRACPSRASHGMRNGQPRGLEVAS